MITAFEVGAIFKIVNKASPTLTAILKQVRDLNALLDDAKLKLSDLGKGSFSTTGLKGAIADVDDYAASWRSVAAAAASAKKAVGEASTASASGGVAAATGAARRGGGAGGVFNAGVAGAGGRMPKIHGTGFAAAGAGLLGYGIYQAASEQDAVYRATYLAGKPGDAALSEKYRKIIEDTMQKTGASLGDVSGGLLQAVRMLQGTKNGGLDILGDVLTSAALEKYLKGTPMSEGVSSLVGLAHMSKTYDPKKVADLLRRFAFLSTVVPADLTTMERAYSYAVPTTESGMGIDPNQTMLLGTVLQRAGITSSKSGTWLRDVLQRGLPGTALQSGVSAKAHEAALRRLNLVDANGKPTWVDANGRLDPLKLFSIGGAALQKIPLLERGALEKQAFGVRGAGAFSVLTDPKVLDQVNTLLAMENSQAYKNQYSSFFESFKGNSPAQQARVAMQTFQVDLMRIGADILPGVNHALGDFISVMDKLRGIIPGANKNPAATGTVIGRAIEGAGIGAGVGAVFGGGIPGAIVGGVVGGVAGGVEGTAEAWLRSKQMNKLATAASNTADQVKKLGGEVRGLPPNVAGWGSAPAQPAPAPSPLLHHTSLTLNVDGRLLAQTVSEQLGCLYKYPTGSTADGTSNWGACDAFGDDI